MVGDALAERRVLRRALLRPARLVARVVHDFQSAERLPSSSPATRTAAVSAARAGASALAPARRACAACAAAARVVRLETLRAVAVQLQTRQGRLHRSRRVVDRRRAVLRQRLPEWGDFFFFYKEPNLDGSLVPPPRLSRRSHLSTEFLSAKERCSPPHTHTHTHVTLSVSLKFTKGGPSAQSDEKASSGVVGPRADPPAFSTQQLAKSARGCNSSRRVI